MVKFLVAIVYLRQLPNVRFFEVVDGRGKFKSLTIIDSATLISQNNNTILRSFINAIELNHLENVGLETSKEFLDLSATSVEAYKKIKASGKNFIAVLDDSQNLIGVVLQSRLEEYFSALVINAVEKK